MQVLRIFPIILSLFNFVQMAEVKIALYDEIKDLPNHPEKLLIDVREPHELENTGRIPTSINIPLGQVKKAFSNEISDDEFELLYGVKKPQLDDYLIFTCRTGNRSNQAILQILPFGYKKVTDALKLDSNEFNNIYQRDKPNVDDEIIFSCLLGGRAQKGADIAVGLGFKNVKNYKGSWTEYAKKEGLKVE